MDIDEFKTNYSIFPSKPKKRNQSKLKANNKPSKVSSNEAETSKKAKKKSTNQTTMVQHSNQGTATTNQRNCQQMTSLPAPKPQTRSRTANANKSSDGSPKSVSGSTSNQAASKCQPTNVVMVSPPSNKEIKKVSSEKHQKTIDLTNTEKIDEMNKAPKKSVGFRNIDDIKEFIQVQVVEDKDVQMQEPEENPRALYSSVAAKGLLQKDLRSFTELKQKADSTLSPEQLAFKKEMIEKGKSIVL